MEVADQGPDPENFTDVVKYPPTSLNRGYFYIEHGKHLGFNFDILPPMKVYTYIGLDVMIPCKPIENENGTPTVEWVRVLDDETQLLNDSRRYVLPNGTLLINEMTNDDLQGTYRCLLTLNSLSVTSAPVNIMNATIGSWGRQPRNYTVTMGNAVRLDCFLFANAPQKNRWLKDDQPLPEDPRFYVPEIGVLQITNVTKEEEGAYRCDSTIPSTKENILSNAGYVRIKAPPEQRPGATSRPTPPTLMAVPTKFSAIVGQRAVLECLVDSLDQYKLIWSRLDERPIRKDVRQEGQGSLVFDNVKEEDAGAYNCSINSSVFKHVTQIMQLAVQKPPTVKLTMFVHQRPHDDELFTVSNGDSVRIRCESIGSYGLALTWYKDGQLISETNRLRITKNISKDNTNITQELAMIYIESADAGVYQCIGSSSIGVASEAIILSVYYLPEMPKTPTNIRLLHSTSESLTISWHQPPSPNNISLNSSGFMFNYYELGVNGSLRNCVLNTSSVKLENLNPYTSYVFYIRAFLLTSNASHAAIGDPTRLYCFRTNATYASRMPVVKLKALSSNQILVIWNPLRPKVARGTVVEQKVEWHEKEYPHYTQNAILNASTYSYVIEDLKPHRWYQIRVLVKTEAGYPPHPAQEPWTALQTLPISHERKKKKFDAHLIVFDKKPTEILVQWQWFHTNYHQNVSNYKVSYNRSIYERQQVICPASSSSVTLTNLDPERCYSVRVIPQYNEDKQNDSALSQSRTICTFPQVPRQSSPRDISKKLGIRHFKVKILNTTSVHLSWRRRRRRVSIDFFTVKVVSLGPEKNTSTFFRSLPDTRGRHHRSDHHAFLPQNFDGSQQQITPNTSPTSNNIQKEESVRFMRVTRTQALIVGLLPRHIYNISATASTTTHTSNSITKIIATKEGVPTAPVNVSWTAVSPKDATLYWGQPYMTNGIIVAYLITYSHNQNEWKNHTVDAKYKTTQIHDLVSNTNYTLKIAGVTGAGVGSYTTVYVYISATLEGASQVSTELVVIGVVCILAVITLVGLGLLCLRSVHMRQNTPSVFQGNGTCRMVCANGANKSSGREHGTELDDYKPMLASLPPATQNRHLDTKGGPGSHDDGIVTNSLFDPSGIQMHQASVPNESVDRQHDSIGNHRMVVALDDIDDGDDASRQLLECVSSQPVFTKNIKDRDSRSKYDSTQGRPNQNSPGPLTTTPIFS